MEVTVLMTVVIVVIPLPIDGRVCDYYVERKTVRCVDTHLTTVPKIPAYMSQLIFTGNIIPAVDRDTFRNVENPVGLEKIVFANNHILNITADAFDDFSNLYLLDLSFNMLSTNDLKFLLKNISVNLYLDKLYLHKISYRLPVDDILSELKVTPSQTLFLGSNGIENFSSRSLQRLKNIKELVLDWNKLFTFELIRIDSLIALRLRGNNFVKIPNFCDKSNYSLTPALRALFMNYNYIRELSANTLMCMPNMINLQFRHNPFTIVRTEMLKFVPKLRFLDIGENTANNSRIQGHALSSNSLVSLRLGFIGNALFIFESIPYTFDQIPILKKLEINNINMGEFSHEMLQCLFSGMKHILYIQCYNCNIRIDPKAILKNKTFLCVIDLANNAIETISPETFADTPNLKKLDLSMNKIAHISRLSLPESMLNKLIYFDMSSNPFNCDCKITWLAGWLKRNSNRENIRVWDYPEGYSCALPSQWNGKMLSEVQFSYRECHPLTTADWVGIIGGPCILFIMSIGIVLYRNRWNIKHYIYLMRKRRLYSKLEGQNYEYDVFVAYNSADSKFIRDFLLPMLEGELNLRLCVHDRDFHVGAFINDNIVEFMNKSRRVLLVLSNNFTTSGWCMFELKLAHSLLVERGVEVIVVLLEDIHGKNMTKPLKVLLDTTTYLEWTDDDVGRDLFVTKLKDSFG